MHSCFDVVCLASQNFLNEFLKLLSKPCTIGVNPNPHPSIIIMHLPPIQFSNLQCEYIHWATGPTLDTSSCNIFAIVLYDLTMTGY